MPIRHHVDKAARRIIAEVPGSFTMEEILDTIDSSVRHPDFEPGFDILSDHTGVTEPITASQTQAMVRHLEGLGPILRGARWATVAPKPASYGMTRMLSVLAERIPMEVEVFETLEDADAWLCSRRKGRRSR